MAKKTYTDSEIASILGRAARLQAQRNTSDGEQLTLEEIRKAAADAGIDQRYVDLAASSSQDHRPSYLNIPTGAGRTQFVQGSLTDATWEKMVALFAREFGKPGKRRSEGSRREWISGKLQITAEEIDGQTVVNAQTGWEDELEGPMALSVIGFIAALVTGFVAVVGEQFLFGLVAALLTVLVVAGFSAYHVQTSRRRDDYCERFEAVLDRCADLLLADDTHEGSTGRKSEWQSSGGELDLPAEEETDNPVTRSGKKSTRS
ncbi:MAG: hypothetical protein U5K31_10545 [Balneolaceae bacterium]|nr:hypothetical protein [Balneolaceae bacterium]